MKQVVTIALSALLTGLVIGSSLTLAVVGHRLEAFMIQEETLISSLQDREEALRKLRENPTTRYIQVTDTAIFLEVEGPDRKPIEDSVKTLLNRFIGRRVEELDPILVHDLFDGRMVEAGGSVYALGVKAVLIAPRVSVYLSAIPREQVPDE